MGAESSAPRDGKSQEDAPASASAASAPTSASAGELSAEVTLLQEEGDGLDSKALQKNGQISGLNGHSEDNALVEVGQPDAVSVAQKEEAPENTDTTQDEVAPQVNGEKVEKESPEANDITTAEEKASEEKPEDATEVGFKKIFRFVGFKFTLKKDKSEEKDPVKLLTVKDKDAEEGSGVEEPTKEAVTPEEKSTDEEKEAQTEASTVEAEVVEDSTNKAEITDAPAEGPAAEDTDEAAKEEGAEEAEASPPQETALSPFKKFFSGGLFSNLRKKASIRKTKEEEEKEAGVEKTEETAAEVEEKEQTVEQEQEIKEEAPVTSEEEKSEPKEETPVTPEEATSEETTEPEVTVEAPAPTAATTDETQTAEDKADGTAEEEKAPAEMTSEAELLSSQEKAKPQGSPLKKLFTGAGLKKLSSKKQKTKKDAESKVTESGEQVAEQLQSSTDSAEAPKAESGPSSPEESGEQVLAIEVTQNESSPEADGEVASDGEKKKEGIIAWSSFKRLVTPKKLVKRSSDSDDEATGEKPAKSATLSSSESAALADKSGEEEAKEEKSAEEEPKTETTEKLVSSTEEPKKKMDTSVSWEALMCMGGTKRRTRKTSDSDDEETKIEEEVAAAEPAEPEQEGKIEAVVATAQNAEGEGEVVSSPEPLSSPPERESTWDTLKRMVMPKNKAKAEEKPEESANQVHSDGEAPKDESSFSLKKFFPGRRKKKVDKQASADLGEEDSDTPAVVPLSEYDDEDKIEQEAPAEPAAVQLKGSNEDRSPSWIPATVEDPDIKNDQLSDIPEEAENAATPKSADTDIAEDETEDQAMVPPKGLGGTGRRLSTAEVTSLTPAPAAEATLVPQEPKSECAKEVMESIDAHISEISPQTSVAVEDLPVEVASEKTEYEPPSEKAESTANTILEIHTREEAMAICTGLGTKEIAKVALEKPAVPLVESMAVVRDGLSSEVLVEEKTARTQQVTVTSDSVHKAQVLQVETTDLEPLVENSQCDVAGIQTAAENYEPKVEKIGVITTALEESGLVQTNTVSENSPKAVAVITPTFETAVISQSIEITQPSVETKEVTMEMEQLVAATEENVPITEVVQVVTEEISSSICKATKISITKETESNISVVLPSEEVPVTAETAAVIAPLNVESDQVTTSEVEVLKHVSVSESVCDELAQVSEMKEDAAVETSTTVQMAEISTEQVNQVTDEIKEETQQACEIETQGMVIAKAVIQDAVGKISEPKKPASPTATNPTPVQAVSKTEKEIEITTETPVITDTAVAIVLEKPAPKSPKPLHVAAEVTDTFAIEVTESINAPEEEKKPVKELKQAVEVKVSEETVVVEEVPEGQSVEKESQEAKSEAPSEEKKEMETPVQVVLQIAQVVEEPTIEEEAGVEFDSNGPVNGNGSMKPESPAGASKLSTLSEESTAEVSTSSQAAAAGQPEAEKAPSGKCAEVMAQVIEVIEEAVKEIEPVSTEITAAS